MVEEFEIENTTPIRVRYADTDQMGIVYNGMYFTYFEVGRTELMRTCGLAYTEFESLGFILPLTQAWAKYISPAKYDDIINVKARLKVKYSPLIRFDYNISRGETTLAEGYTEHSFLDNITRKPVRPPRIFYETVEKFRNK